MSHQHITEAAVVASTHCCPLFSVHPRRRFHERRKWQHAWCLHFQNRLPIYLNKSYHFIVQCVFVTAPTIFVYSGVIPSSIWMEIDDVGVDRHLMFTDEVSVIRCVSCPHRFACVLSRSCNSMCKIASWLLTRTRFVLSVCCPIIVCCSV